MNHEIATLLVDVINVLTDDHADLKARAIAALEAAKGVPAGDATSTDQVDA